MTLNHKKSFNNELITATLTVALMMSTYFDY